MSGITFTDSNATVPEDGDPVTLIKDLKLKGLALKAEFPKKA
ncbi:MULTISPECIES: PhnA domain-containing protein [unclassified Streptomyces]